MKLNRILNEFEIDSSSINSDFTINESALPKQRVDGKILTKSGRHRCTLLYETIQGQGRYGIIQACKRVEGAVITKAVVKRPRSPSQSLAPEATLQAVCYNCVEDHGLSGSISKPLDLFLFANEVRFTMEFVDGMSFREFIGHHGEAEIVNCIMQLAAILHALEEIRFDHRDLRIENVWIRPLASAQNYKIQIDGPKEIEFKFQVVLLDFGFACLGGKVNLGDSVFSPIDPCPKYGRDLYQFLISCFEFGIADRLTPGFVRLLKEWMKPYTVIPTTLTYVTTADPKFKLGKLRPVELLRWYFRMSAQLPHQSQGYHPL